MKIHSFTHSLTRARTRARCVILLLFSYKYGNTKVGSSNKRWKMKHNKKYLSNSPPSSSLISLLHFTDSTIADAFFRSLFNCMRFLWIQCYTQSALVQSFFYVFTVPRYVCMCVCASAFSKYIFLRSSFQFLVYYTFLFVSLCSHIVTRTLKSNGNGCKLKRWLFRAVMAIGDSVFGGSWISFFVHFVFAECALWSISMSLCFFIRSPVRSFIRTFVFRNRL